MEKIQLTHSKISFRAGRINFMPKCDAERKIDSYILIIITTPSDRKSLNKY